MNNEVILPWLDVGIKYSVLQYSMYYLFARCAREKPEKSDYAAAGFYSIAMGVSLIWIRPFIKPMHAGLILVFLILTNCLRYRGDAAGSRDDSERMSLPDVTTLSVLCFAFCYAVYFVTGFLGSVVLSIFYDHFVPPERNSVSDFLHDIPLHIAGYAVMIFLYWYISYLAAGMKRFRRGLLTIVKSRSAGVGIMLSALLLVLGTVFSGFGTTDTSLAVKTLMLIPTLVMGVVVVVWIRREISAEYIRQLRKRNADLLIKSHAEKNGIISSLLSDNEGLAAVMRSDNLLLAELDGAFRSHASPEGIARAAESVEKAYADRSRAISALESQGCPGRETGVKTVDAILGYMAGMAKNIGIDFAVDVSANLGGFFSGERERLEFGTMLADLTENAIIATQCAGAEAVGVHISKEEGNCCLEVLDSGDVFAEEVLREMGRKPITTHSGEGGSGIGLMTLCKILHRNGAALTIEEYPAGGKYTKSVRVTFDGSGRMKLITDRFDQWRPLRKPRRFGRFEISRRENVGAASAPESNEKTGGEYGKTT